MKTLIICGVICLLLGFFVGRFTMKEGERTTYVKGETIRDTITCFIPDTVRLSGEVRYKYRYKTDTVYRDVPTVDREGTIKSTIEDWNLIRDYKRTLFDNESGKLAVELSVQYNELKHLTYAYTPVRERVMIVKKSVWVPFVSASFYTEGHDLSFGGGCFYHDLGFRIEYKFDGFNVGLMYKF